MDFFQEKPRLKNTWDSDARLRAIVASLPLSGAARTAVEEQLRHMGELAVTTWLADAERAESSAPKHVSFDEWGRRVDTIELSEGWKRLEAAAATEGIVATAFERAHGEWSRVVQAAMLYLFHPSSAFVSCPLAMTDGAARAIELFGDEELKARAYPRLISRDPAFAWTSGQWMTERRGGSDVSGTETTARVEAAGLFTHSLTGVKWFTSATTSQMAMLLARGEGAEAGSRGLSLFYTELRDGGGALKNIEILRLKDKLGTKALPTAELRLNGLPARLVGGEGGGVRKISALFNITRVYNSICALGHARRALDWAWSYARIRTAFGRPLVDQPLHRETLEGLEFTFARMFRLTFFVAHLLGRDECGTASDDERVLLRALTPIAKLWTAKKCVEICSEVVESFGGAGYIENVGVARLLRDAQVFSIWEGTTNVLALDFIRALEREGALPVLLQSLENMAPGCFQAGESFARVEEIGSITKLLVSGPRDALERQGRRLAYLVAELAMDCLETRERLGARD